MDEKVIAEIKARTKVFCMDKYDGIFSIQELATVESAMLIGASIVLEKQAEHIDEKIGWMKEE